ncbi:MAG: RES family NAD+ phosphorylase [Actinomycetes bacterium]
MTRGTTRQEPPPADLSKFPETKAPRTVYRAVRRGPWWFCTDGLCRFDLTDPAASRGTLYAAIDKITPVLEVIGPEFLGRPISRAFLAQRELHQLRITPTSLAALSDRSASGFGVSNELTAMTPYAVPQQWATGLDSQGFGGILYRSRFNTAAIPTAIALFGPAGQAKQRSVSQGACDSASILAALKRAGHIVDQPPPLSGLDVIT